MLVETKLINIFKKNELSLSKDINSLNIYDKFSDIGLDSVNFVKLIVYIEDEFCFEFDDEYLNLDLFDDLNSMIVYINKKLNI
jgi:acyl carrier protein